MTKFLSQSLQATEPAFRLGLQRLEAAHGGPNHDIRISVAIAQQTKQKLAELGLDPRDTTAPELYHALQQRVQRDDASLHKRLRTLAATHVSAEGKLIDGLVHALQAAGQVETCFAIKPVAFRALIKALPPKKTMKALGYRSAASFIKQENPASILTAARLIEDARWQQRLTESYKRLQPTDFETRKIAIVQPSHKRWQQFEQLGAASKNNVLAFRELGVVVLLPLPEHAPKGSTLASCSLAFMALNAIAISSTFLKLQQVRADFGAAVQHVAQGEARLALRLLDRPVSWELVQRYFAQAAHGLGATIFEPYVQAEDMLWQSVEQGLSKIEPQLQFWQGTAHLGLLHEGKAVSMNLVDAALNHCNHLPFESRLSRYFQRSLHHELLTRYLRPEVIEQAVWQELHPQLATEMALAS